VKIFAPYETNGGFSTRYAFGYWLGMSYVIAVGDTYDAEGRTHNGRGVEPDVVVLPKQSELLVGIDSVHAAALAWVREELAQ
jgi:C-terminal processing protease CtpA/Prc